MLRVFELVKREAARYGVAVLESEIVGLVPAAALVAAAEWYLQLEGFTPRSGARDSARRAKRWMRVASATLAALSSSGLELWTPRRDPERAHLAIQIAPLDAQHLGRP